MPSPLAPIPPNAGRSVLIPGRIGIRWRDAGSKLCPQGPTAHRLTNNSLLTAIDEHSLVLALGPAGTGKTYLAIAKAVEALEAGKVGRIVLSRPAVEAGESIGFLPGDMEDKLAPYLRPLYDALSDRLSMKRVRALMAEGAIEIAPVGFMRGRTLNNAFVVIDEAQNCTYVQLKMLLTRLGWHSTMVVTGDPQPVGPAARHLRPRRRGRPAGGGGRHRRRPPGRRRHRPPPAGRRDAGGAVGRLNRPSKFFVIPEA